MKLQQLRYIIEIANHNLNVSQTAEHLFTSQPGISKQVRQLEEELGVKIFERSGKNFVRITPAGKRIIDYANQMFSLVKGIRSIAQEYSDPTRGELSISTTHTQACYALPKVLKLFMERYPNVHVELHQGSPTQIKEDLTQGRCTFAIATESHDMFEGLISLPCYYWNRCIIVPKDHPLAERKTLLTLVELARYPLLTYTFGFSGTSHLTQTFEAAGLEPKMRLTATDADVIKTYVRQGVGVGILANMAVNNDDSLVKIDASHLFAPEKTALAFRKDTFLRSYMYDFIQAFAPHLNRRFIEQVMQTKRAEDRQKLYEDLAFQTR